MAAPTRTPSHKDSTNTAAWDANIPDFKGYNGSPNLKRAGVVCNYTQEMKDEFIRCRDDVMYFCEKYIKIVHVDHGLIPIRLYDYQKEIIESSQQHRKTIVLTSRQAGKALALDTKIPLPDGTFTTMGNLKVGDMVIGSSGIPVKVTFTSEIHHKPTYKMYFDDGSTVVACEDHQWVVDDSITGNSMRLSTKEIALGSAFTDSTRFSIRNASAILYSKLTRPVASFDDSPDEWLTAPVVDRFCLVHEMIKTPTTVKVGSSFTVYPSRVDKFARLVNSLGYTAIIDGNSVSFDLRKTHRTIVDIHPVDIVPTRCITVDADDHLFLFGESFIPTHNTTVATCVILHYILFNKHKTVAILANKGDAALEIMSRIQLAYEYLPRWLQSGIVEWNKGSIELENGSKVIASATSGSAIRGKSCVSGDTLVRIRNKQTGAVLELPIEDISNPRRYQIFDGETFRDFLEIRVQEKELFRIETATGLHVDATGDHRILSESGEWVTVDDIDHTTVLMHGGQVLSKESIGVDSVYDPVDVEESSRYWGNGLIHHNCSLVYIDECVGADTKITLLDDSTGAQFETTIGDLFIELEHTVDFDGIATIVANTRYSVLSETGFVNFSSIKKTTGKSINIHFSDGSHLECSYSHKIKMLSGNFSEAHEILVGDNTSTGLCVTAIEHGSQDVDLYDLLDVAAGNEYLTGSVTSHNCAFVEGWDDFYTSVYPTISSGKTTKMLFTSTSNSLNHYYKFWVDAKNGINGFNPIEVKWDRIPGRDEAWRQETLAGMNFDHEKFEQEFNCSFMGSAGTLIAGSALKALAHHIPIYEWEGFSQYVAPVKNRSYAIVCDVSRGKGLDYSAFSVIDVTCMPYDQVATYRANTITPTDYAGMINKIGVLYNMASVLVENNDMGGQVASLLFEDHDYDNLLFSMSNGKAGKVLCGGGSNAELGVRTTTAVKSKGCAVLKLLIEQQQLIIRDFNTIGELSRFTKKGKSYEAESGHDDLVMGLVLFSWMTVNPYFSNLTDVVTMHGLGESTMDDCLPFGFIDDGVEAYHEAETGEIQNAGWSLGY